MPETNECLRQTYKCTAKECAKELKSINEWRLHVEGYSFQEGHICLYDNCGDFISTCTNESLAQRSHLYLRHDVQLQDMAEVKNLHIDKNHCSVEKGKIWCSGCHKSLDLENRANVLDHIEEHVRHGTTIQVPGQTKVLQLSGGRPEGSSSLVVDRDDGVIDLSQRGAIVWLPPA